MAMIGRAWLPLFALVLSASLLWSAPAPFPGPKVAETVLGVGNPSQGARLRARLTSPAFLRQLLLAPKVRSLYSLRGEKDALAWLQARLTIDLRRQGKEVRIRIANCRGPEALALLSTLVELSRGSLGQDTRERQMMRLEMMRAQVALQQAQVQARLAGNLRVRVLDDLTSRLELEQRPPSVVQKPRLVLPRD
jgi:hypothetical protein